MDKFRAVLGFFAITPIWIAAALANAPPLPASAPPPPGTKPAGEVRSEKFTIPLQLKHADLAGEGDKVHAKIVLPAKMRGLPPPAGAPARAGAGEQSPSRSLIAAAALSLAAVSVVFVLRGRKLSTTSKAAVLGVAGLLGLFGAAQADIIIPGQKRNPRPMPPAPAPGPALVEAKAMIVIEFSADVEDATLILPAK